MNRVGTLALFLASAAVAATCGGHGTRESLIVSTPWLADHIKLIFYSWRRELAATC